MVEQTQQQHSNTLGLNAKQVNVSFTPLCRLVPPSQRDKHEAWHD